jgi:hypothetical protein
VVVFSKPRLKIETAGKNAAELTVADSYFQILFNLDRIKKEGGVFKRPTTTTRPNHKVKDVSNGDSYVASLVRDKRKDYFIYIYFLYILLDLHIILSDS